MNRDQLYGGLIFIASLVIAVIYIAAFLAETISAVLPVWPAWLDWWAVAIPVFVFTLAALLFLMWIGWTMLRTPPPAPVESIETEPAGEPSRGPEKHKE